MSTFAGIIHTVFSRIRHYSAGSPVILNRLLEAIAAFAPYVLNDRDREAVREEADAVVALGRAAVTSPTDLAELERRYDAAVAALARSVTPAGRRP